MVPKRNDRERERRETVQRAHTMRAASEAYEAQKAAATSQEERDRITAEFSAFRTKHRQEDIQLGKRQPGVGVLMHQVMWALWIEIAAESETKAQLAFQKIVSGNDDALLEELQQSLVAITAAACTVEALYEDIKYLIDEQKPRLDSAHENIGRGFAVAFGWEDEQVETFSAGLRRLFEQRNEAVHPYSEPKAPLPHPSGLVTSSEAARFNSAESHSSVEFALRVLGQAEHPTSPANAAVTRWAKDRRQYFETIVAPIRARYGEQNK
ncbi:hypothetical protein [Pseudarthrobacter sulfonivorans]|uniref:hypothetical protein n=1 Tax=Pseudarthrobacter sulfonivorans TaxID=121292 RepID=UPI002857DBAE|nr:hypothetical protein [Pseudarthrobacter sulfonivorans]MDR6417586.1 hypothetical protein [Pseudarthrobacter sulfonivorans]